MDLILYKLDELKAGEEVLYNEFEDVRNQIKIDFLALQSQYPLGKKSYFQLALGKIASYTGNKLADEIFEALKPQIIAFLMLQSPQLVEHLHKLIG
ncbi:hypothetical protein HK413_08425 [Mucilaginibacter sp. S1162]|uniref:Uncharacterized protein n=1 Tax=Mucilaginibacter humi TaxID=2732510 RepID=A0ABX1W2H3_9SPHI|nr:hypothetical protein [Mucilaginibacter humi]NNU34163.1 hypothetical protein [Mucilaginibacter humi]